MLTPGNIIIINLLTHIVGELHHYYAALFVGDSPPPPGKYKNKNERKFHATRNPFYLIGVFLNLGKVYKNDAF